MIRLTRRTVGALVVIAIIALIIVSRGVHVMLLGVLDQAQRIAVDHPLGAAALVVLFAAVGAMVAFVSSWLIVPLAVFTWGEFGALGLLWAGWLLGGATAYAIGRFLGRPAVQHFVAAPQLAQYESRVTQRSAFAVVLLLQLGLPSEIPGYLLGLVRYPFRWYVVSLGVAELIHGVATVYLGSQLLERRLGPLLAIGLALALLTAAAAYGLRRRLSHDAIAAA